MNDQSSNRIVDSLRLFVDIARLRRGPEDLPVDRSLLTATVLAYGLLNLAFAMVLPGQMQQPQSLVLALVLLDIAVTLVALHFLLRLAHKPERFRQTAAAMFGFQIALAPAVLASALLTNYYGKDQTWQLPVSMLRFVLAVWVLAVAARILRSATEWPLAACVGLVITLELLLFLLLMLFFPQMQALIVPAQS